MVNVGDRIRLSLNKGTDREGVVTGVTGSMLRVRWSSEEETSVVPAPGTLTVLGRSGGKASGPRKKAAGSRKATDTRTSATKNVPSKKAPSKKSTGTTGKAGVTKKTAAMRQAASKKAAKGQPSAGSRRRSR